MISDPLVTAHVAGCRDGCQDIDESACYNLPAGFSRALVTIYRGSEICILCGVNVRLIISDCQCVDIVNCISDIGLGLLVEVPPFLLNGVLELGGDPVSEEVFRPYPIVSKQMSEVVIIDLTWFVEAM